MSLSRFAVRLGGVGNALRNKLVVRSMSTSTRPKHVLTLDDLEDYEIRGIAKLGIMLKHETDPAAHASLLPNKSLLMFFNKPSLRTRLSFEVGMTQLGGHGIFYHLEGQNLGTKESFSDTSIVSSSMVDVIMARLQSRHEIAGLAQHSNVPVINALDDWGHPCQLLADYMTIAEVRGEDPLDESTFKGLKFAYVGDIANNVTYDIIRGGAILGMNVHVAGPPDPEYAINELVMADAYTTAERTGAKISVTDDPKEAVQHADIVYTDTWMSYGLSKQLESQRLEVFSPYAVTEKLMSLAKPNAKFMHCLPALRGVEVTQGVIDGEQSVVFTEAENRLHAQKALLLYLLGKAEITPTSAKILW